MLECHIRGGGGGGWLVEFNHSLSNSSGSHHKMPRNAFHLALSRVTKCQSEFRSTMLLACDSLTCIVGVYNWSPFNNTYKNGVPLLIMCYVPV